MKKSIKKIISLLCICVMVAGMFSGCGKSKETSKTDVTPTQKADESTGETKDDTTITDTTDATEVQGAYPDYAGGFKEKVTIQMPVYDRAFEGWNVTDNYYTKWIQSQFGDEYNVNVEFVAIGRTTEVTDYTQMLAAGTAPDIIFHYDMPQALAYYGEGAIQKLDLDEIAYYAPTYAKNLGDTNKTYGVVDGANYFFFGKRPDAYNFVTLIRQDWLDAVGKPMPTSLEEYNEVFAAWKEAGLGNGGGTLVQNNFTYDYAFRPWPIDKNERALYSDLSIPAFTWEPTHKYLKNLNYQYNNGLIDPEFYLNTDEASTQADFVAGNTGAFAFYLTSSSTVISNLLTNNPEAKVAVLNPKANVPKGDEFKPQGRAYWPFGMIMGINSTTTPEERAAIWMYLEWMSQSENLFYLQNGVEGQNYTLDASGLAVKVPDFAGESKLSNNNNKDYWCLVVESAQYADEDLNYKANLTNWAPGGYEYLIEDAYKYYKENLEYATPDALFSVVLESVAEYKSDLNDLWKELYVKCAMATEAEFESVYQDACKEFLDAGYQAILDEKTKAIESGLFN
ncbi:MAG: extracellular solute-binding protein family 1 [Anaerocolumna sp.]|jgi:putative aldouronate transport system substrate-binding protein|nr:extracellular solute-binding protein family 1 [Anaerocolumna sp.]